MPWSIERREGQYCVIKEDDGENEGCHDTRPQAEAQMRALYASENRTEEPRAPIETRAATVGKVNYPKRIIEVIAAPYDQEAVVEWRSEIWRESFERGAFDGLEKMPGRIRANRDHDKTRLVGKAVAWHPSRDEGLVGEIFISDIPLGNETLELAKDDVLNASVGFGVLGRDQVLDRTNMRRRIKVAWLDHLAFVPDSAYESARVLAVRENKPDEASRLPKLETPRIDEVLAWMASRPGRD